MMGISFRQLFDDPKIAFVAARKFLMDGTSYKPGDIVPNAVIRDVRNREAIIRSHRVVAVTNDLNDVPRAYRKTIKDRGLFFRKLRVPDEAVYSTQGKNIDAVQADLSERLLVRVWASALLSEQTHANPRPTLVAWIKAGDAPKVSAANLQSFVENEANYAPGGYLEAYTIVDGAAAY